MGKDSGTKGPYKRILTIALLSVSVLYLIVQIVVGFDLLACESFTYFLQGSGTPSSTLTSIMRVFSDAGYDYLEFLIIVFIALDPIKTRSIKVLILNIASKGFADFLKVFYRQPRPFYVFTDIQALNCNTSYGNPSTHATRSAFTLAAIYYIYLHCDSSKYTTNIPYEPIAGTHDEKAPLQAQENQEERAAPELHKLGEESHCLIWLRESKCLKFTIIVFFIIWGFLTALARVYLGAHSVGQIFAGWSYAYILFVLFVYMIERPLDNYLAKLCLKNFSSAIAQYLYLGVFTAVSIVIPVILYEALRRDATVMTTQNTWNQAVQACGISDTTIINSAFQDLSFPSLILAIFFGLLLSNHYKNGYLHDNLQDLTFIRLVGRVLLYLVIFIGISKLFRLIPNLQNEVEDAYFNFFVKWGWILLSLQGLAISVVVPLLFRPFRLLPAQKKQEYFPKEGHGDEKEVL